MNDMELAATDLVAGVDVSKAQLDMQVEPGAATRSFPNAAGGWRAARDWLRGAGRAARSARANGTLPSGPAALPRRGRPGDCPGRPAPSPAVCAQHGSARQDRSHRCRHAGPLRAPAGPAPGPSIGTQSPAAEGLAVGPSRLCRGPDKPSQTHRRIRSPGPAAAALGRLNEATDREIGVLDQAIAKALEADEALARRAAILRSVAGYRPRLRGCALRRLARTRQHRPQAGRGPGRHGSVRQRQRRIPRRSPHPRRATPTAQGALHGRHRRPPLQPRHARRLPAAGRPRQGPIRSQ